MHVLRATDARVEGSVQQLTVEKPVKGSSGTVAMAERNTSGPRVLQDRMLSVGVRHVALCPKMDVIALALDGATVVLQRLNWQRLATISPSAPSKGLSSARTPVAEISALVWAPDASALAIGSEDGLVRVVRIDAVVGAPQKMQTTRGATGGSAETKVGKPVTALSWIAVPQHQPVAYADRDQAELDPGGILAVGQADGHVTFFSFHLAFTIASLRPLPPGHSVSQILVSSDMPFCCTAGKASSSSKISASNSLEKISLACRKLDPLWEVQNELFRFGSEVVILSDILHQLEGIITSCEKLWLSEVLTSFETTIVKPLTELCSNFAEEHRGGPWGVLYSAFCGIGTSTALEQFLACHLKDSGAKELLRSFTSTSEQMKSNLQKGLPFVERVVFRLSEFRGLVRFENGFSKLGVTVQSVDRAFDAAAKLLEQLSLLVIELETTQEMIKAVLRWILKEALRIMGTRSEAREAVQLQASESETSMIASFFETIAATDNGVQDVTPVTSMYSEAKHIFETLSIATQTIFDAARSSLTESLLCDNDDDDESLNAKDIRLVRTSSSLLQRKDIEGNMSIEWYYCDEPHKINVARKPSPHFQNKQIKDTDACESWLHSEVVTVEHCVRAICCEKDLLSLVVRGDAKQENATYYLLVKDCQESVSRHLNDGNQPPLRNTIMTETAEIDESLSSQQLFALCQSSANARCYLDTVSDRSLACAVIGNRRLILIDLGSSGAKSAK